MRSTHVCVGASITFDRDDRSESATITIGGTDLASVSMIALKNIIRYSSSELF